MIKGLTIKAGTHPTTADFMVGDQKLMVMSADIRMRPDEVITATIEVPVEHIDVELLTSGVTITPLGGYDLKEPRVAYIVVSDTAPSSHIKTALSERRKYLESKFPNEKFEIRVVKQSEIGEA